MAILQNISIKIGLARWWIGLGIALAICAALFVAAVVPLSAFLKNQISIWHETNRLKQSSLLLPAKIRVLDSRITVIDSLIQSCRNVGKQDQAAILEKLYTLADSSSCTLSKVQAADIVTTNAGKEQPIALEGQGDYSAIGKFVDGIENMNASTRIRQLTIHNGKEGVGSFTVDFVVIE